MCGVRLQRANRFHWIGFCRIEVVGIPGRDNAVVVALSPDTQGIRRKMRRTAGRMPTLAGNLL